MYRKLKRVWRHNDMEYIPKFRELFPELNKVSGEELCGRFQELGCDFYTQQEKEVKPLLRLTLPFALILMFVMFVFLPIRFIIYGGWGYEFNETNRIYNWFKSLRLVC